MFLHGAASLLSYRRAAARRQRGCCSWACYKTIPHKHPRPYFVVYPRGGILGTFLELDKNLPITVVLTVFPLCAITLSLVAQFLSLSFLPLSLFVSWLCCFCVCFSVCRRVGMNTWLPFAQGGLSLNAWVDREGRDRTTAKILVRIVASLLCNGAMSSVRLIPW